MSISLLDEENCDFSQNLRETAEKIHFQNQKPILRQIVDFITTW